MRVAYGVSALAAAMRHGGADGIGHVTQELLIRLQRTPGLHILPFEYTPCVCEDTEKNIPGTIAVGDFQKQAALSLLLGAPFTVMQRQLQISKTPKTPKIQGAIDIVHATDHFIPRLRTTPILATIMDAIPLAHPEWVDYSYKAVKNEAWRRSAHWAQHIVTISEFSKQEISRWFRIPENKISVIPLGVDQRWHIVPDANEIMRVRKAHNIPEHFFLFIGTLQPRKNLAHLIQAYSLLPASMRQECPLIIAGRKGWGCDDLVHQLQAQTINNVRWLNYVPGEDLPTLLSLATALVFPSLYEGFGLPVLEAFAAHTPVIASSTTSIPEVAGDAALLVHPQDINGWRDAMHAIWHDHALAQSLKNKGKVRVDLFSWEQTKSSLHQLYTKIAGQ